VTTPGQPLLFRVDWKQIAAFSTVLLIAVSVLVLAMKWAGIQPALMPGEQLHALTILADSNGVAHHRYDSLALDAFPRLHRVETRLDSAFILMQSSQSDRAELRAAMLKLGEKIDDLGATNCWLVRHAVQPGSLLPKECR